MLDETYDNNFKFTVCKDYDETYSDDADIIYSSNVNNLIWYSETAKTDLNFCWKYDSEDGDDEKINSLWGNRCRIVYKAEISESNYSIQLCIEGDLPS